MIPSLQSFCWSIQDTAGMPRIAPRARLKPVAGNSGCFRRLWIWQTNQSISHRAPTSGKWKHCNPLKPIFHVRRCLRTLCTGNLVFIPICSIYPLRRVERVAGVSCLRKTPRLVDVPTESNNHHTLAVLRHSKISGINFLKNDAVTQAKFHTCRVVFFQPRQVICPRLTFLSNQLWILKL